MAVNLNPFFLLQARIASLIAASSYFAGVPASQILTEQVADLEYQVNETVLKIGFGVVVTTASGKAREDEYNLLMTDEDLNVSIIHNPSMDPTHTALDAAWAIIQALQGQTCQETPPPVPRPFDLFRITGHQKRTDGPPGCAVHEVHVLAGLRMS